MADTSMNAVAAPVELVFPTIRLVESQAPGLSEKKVGQRVKAILSFGVVEKTKSFTLLRLGNVYVIQKLSR